MPVPPPIRKALGIYDRQMERLNQAIRQQIGYFDSIRVLPYNGFGASDGVWLKGRVLADDKVDAEQGDNELEKLANMFRRAHTDEVPEAQVRVSFGKRTVQVETSWEGFFDVDILPDESLEPEALWHDVDLELISPRPHVDQPTFRFRGEVQIPSNPRIGIISDIDDTIIKTGADTIFRQARIVLLNGPYSRTPFAGVGAFYRALQNVDGEPTNPMFYVSSSPWNMYDLFDEFFRAHDIPKGTIFLTDFGLDRDKFIAGGHDHKTRRIQRVLDTYPDLDFIFIGDTGQHDPKLYRELVYENPGRVAAVYIRDVHPNVDEERDAEVGRIAEELESEGVQMLRVEDTLDAARHACEHGYIEPADLDRVVEACRAEQARPDEPRGAIKRLASRFLA
ncbi:DUF2183 domain-containing protein [Persicimonas caeni]|uniref:DUF2183 domain-containing protein n=1 Tax=Persicimonas caeni TaxID=2292766 RepID=A0A4Y6Q065_PERCE|nr:phosphatase domain-containing protein [Persicimonas caeni]QDG53903.1 DUF2183 domain-containing protein [Persicimonas caeni]QED35124.1 DUF2183 domain-containing protein [Persicimonas caeni]